MLWFGLVPSRFLETVLDVVSSELPDATVLACDKGDWCERLKLNMDAKPLVCFETKYGEHGSGRFRSESAVSMVAIFDNGTQIGLLLLRTSQSFWSSICCIKSM